MEIHSFRSHIKDHLVLEWKFTAFRSHIYRCFVLELNALQSYNETHSKLVVGVSLLRMTGSHYFERGFPLQKEVIPDMNPTRVDFHSGTFREYIAIELLRSRIRKQQLFLGKAQRKVSGSLSPCSHNV